MLPRVNMKQQILNEAAAGAKGVACKTEYMNSDLFVNDYLPFFVGHAKPTSSEPVLFILDNNSSHISLQSVESCKENHIISLTLPPHTAHRLQPLDLSVYGSLKRYLNTAMDDWQRSHPGRALTIYEMAQLLGVAFTKSVTNTNITAGFRAKGIFLCESDIFEDSDFLPADVTEQPTPKLQQPGPEAQPDDGAQPELDQQPRPNPEPQSTQEPLSYLEPDLLHLTSKICHLPVTSELYSH